MLTPTAKARIEHRLEIIDTKVNIFCCGIVALVASGSFIKCVITGNQSGEAVAEAIPYIIGVVAILFIWLTYYFAKKLKILKSTQVIAD
ncbi:hypothetical protein [Paenibacillus glucanolyticus]|uniref:hypothetical protein n=1 Tax=Paenibacillus glucanolyticus TaxID=59843 RepID=UPI00096E9EF0|nr:hypothetical protein [Paenibacillus glucanolyticus]OMF76701.1 hypothetical protein BK142_14360 [Paenibacillus glucanolyticus]